MNVSEAMALIGKTATYKIDDMSFTVAIVDVRQVFNRIDYKITPAKGCGSGTKWVDARKVRL